MATTTTVRVTTATRERLRRLTALTGKTSADLLDELTARAEEDALIAQFNAFFADEAAARRYHRMETEAFERVLADGLKHMS